MALGCGLCPDPDKWISTTLCTRDFKWKCRTHARICSCHGCQETYAQYRSRGEYETSGKRAVFCPHCGDEQDEESTWMDLSESEREWECGYCEKPFVIEQNVTIRYSTHKPDDWEEEKEEDEDEEE